MENIAASSIATLCAELSTIPICTVKTIYQTNLNDKSLLQSASKLYKQRGIRGFYNASSYAFSSQIISTTSKYTFYNKIKEFRKTPGKDLINNNVNGAIAGIFGSFFSHPFDVLKIHKQNGVDFKKEFKKQGPTIYYNGFKQGLSKNVCLSTVLFPIHDFYRMHYDSNIQCAVLTTLSVTSVIHPIDLLKTRSIAKQPLFLGFNPISYYRGVHLNLMRAIPHFTITIYTIDFIKKMYKAATI
jgi:hypothetical protein